MTSHPVAVIVGAPGAGKTTVGSHLAQRLGVDFVDIDQVVSQTVGKSIADIFIEDGEPEFRRLEREAVSATLRQAPGVVSLGGGAVVDPQVRALLVEQRVVWLRVSASQAAARVGLSGARPLLLGNVRGTLIALLEERAPFYAEVADIIIDTDDRTVGDIVAETAARLEDA